MEEDKKKQNRAEVHCFSLVPSHKWNFSVALLPKLQSGTLPFPARNMRAPMQCTQCRSPHRPALCVCGFPSSFQKGRAVLTLF